MRITVKVKPGSKMNAVEKLPDGSYSLRVKARALEGRANDAVVEVLSEHFSVAKSRIRIVKGLASRNKVVDIE